MKTKLALLMSVVLCMAMASQAMVIRNYCNDKEESSKSESGIFNEDYLFLGHELNFSGEAEDLVFLGRQLNFSGKTKLGLIALGKNLVYSGASGNGIIAAGMNIAINGTSNGTNYIACKSFTLSDSAVVNGNLFVAGAKLTINGKLNGDLYAGAGELVINSPIQGNVVAHGGRIIIGKNGGIHGNLTYTAKEKLSTEELAKVTGIAKVDEKFTGDKDWKDFVTFIASVKFIILYGLYFACVIIGCLLLFLPVFNKFDAKQSAKTFWNTALWGLIPMLMYPAVVVLCVAMIITIPFAIVLVLASFPLLFMTSIIGTTLLGKYLVLRFKWNVTKRHNQFLIGSAAGFILSLIPFINFLSVLFISSLGWGTYLSFLFNKDLTVQE